MRLLLDLLALIRALAADRARLTLENLVLPQQLNVLRRSVNRARLDDSDRIFWVLIHRLFKEWKKHLVVVKPETVIRWHRQGFRYYAAREPLVALGRYYRDECKPEHRATIRCRSLIKESDLFSFPDSFNMATGGSLP